MAENRIVNLVEDIRRLQARVSGVNRGNMGAAHAALRTYLQSSATQSLERTQRAGSNERANALRTLALIENAPRSQHVDNALLAALVWTAIERYRSSQGDAQTRQDVANMRFSLAQSLAQCIEDDEHAVCIWGQGQRLLSSLGGYGFDLSFEEDLLRPSPRDLLMQLGRNF